MKRLIKNNNCLEFDISVEVYVDESMFSIEGSAVDSSKFNIPSGPVISKFANQIGSQMVTDYDTFVEDIVDFIEDNLELELIYTNASKNNSRHFSFIARDENGNIYLRFRLRLRISNHDPHSSKQQKALKKKEKEEILKQGKLTEYQLRKMQKLTKSIIVNDETYDSYLDAFIDITEQAEEWVTKMKR